MNAWTESTVTQRRLRRPRLRIRTWSTTGKVIGVLVAAWVVQTAVTHLVVTLTLLGVLALTAGAWWGRGTRARIRIQRQPGTGLLSAAPHRMSPDEFEQYLAQLCRRDGCTNVTVVGGAGDLAADVLYTDPHGRRGLIQAKRYKTGNNVGSQAVQCVNGTYRHAHGADHAAIVTTSNYTRAAEEFAAKVGIPLLAADRLNAWARGDHRAAPWN